MRVGQIGVIAEGKNRALPELVGHDKVGQVMGVECSRPTTALIEAVKTQRAQNQRQQRQIAAQQA